MEMTAAEAILRVIKEQGTDVVFGYPGATTAPIYDRLPQSGLRHILTRNEQGAAHAAVAYGIASDKVGVCIVTSGPGVTNLLTGIANAYMDSVPLVAITGQVACSQVGTDSFQEVDTTGVTTPVTKHNYLIKNKEELLPVLREAFIIAKSGRPGPVVVDVPLDIQKELVEFTPDAGEMRRNILPTQKIDKRSLNRLLRALGRAKKPLIIAGGGIMKSGASEELTRFAQALGIPVASTMMGLTALSGTHPLCLGMVGRHGTDAANQAYYEADTVLFIGSRISDRTVPDWDELSGRATIIHIDIDPAEINKNIPADISLIGDCKEILSVLLARIGEVHCPEDWAKKCADKSKKKAFSKRSTHSVTPAFFLELLSEKTSDDTLITTEVGQHQIWVAKHYTFQKPNTLLTSGGFGTMGFGLPAAIGAKLARPAQTVIALEGDGSFQMAMPELATMKQAGTEIKIVLFTNRSLGMVREYQTLMYQSNYVGVDLGVYPRFDKIAEAYDIPYRAIRCDSEVSAGIDAMLSCPGSFLLELVIDESETTVSQEE
ncbi:MAG: biosynthetic-type acetolactate synthase large subunit [Clostridia bacterium]|nr:biosynthetic-type acetolactate synthase large subunit [Clostridia bacterium]